MKAKKIVLAAVLFLALCACSDDNVMNPVQPLAPTFANVEQILNNGCAFTGCHGSTNPNPIGQPLILVTGSSYDRLVNAPSAQTSGFMLVRPGLPDSSALYLRITGRGGRARMPFFGDPLPSDQTDLIRRWIESGALKN